MARAIITITKKKITRCMDCKHWCRISGCQISKTKNNKPRAIRNAFSIPKFCELPMWEEEPTQSK